MSLSPYGFILEKLFHYLLRGKNMEKDISLKLICFCLSVCFSQSSNRVKLCDSLCTIQWKPPCLCVPLPTDHMACVRCAMYVLHDFAEYSSHLLAVTLKGLCSLNVLIFLSHCSLPSAKVSGLTCLLQAMKIHIPVNCGPNWLCHWSRLTPPSVTGVC